MAKPSVVILGTGGTIAGQADSDAPGYRSGVLNVDALIGTAPEIRDIADVSAEQIANIGSQDMNDSVWLALAHRIAELRAAGDVAGVVITHGTDTMEETAFFLDCQYLRLATSAHRCRIRAECGSVQAFRSTG